MAAQQQHHRRRRARLFKGDWVQLVTTTTTATTDTGTTTAAAAPLSLVLKPPAQHGDPVALAPLAASEFAAVSLVAVAAPTADDAAGASAPTAPVLAVDDVVTVAIAGGFLAWAAELEQEGQPSEQPRALRWVDEDELAEAERASLRPCRFRVASKAEAGDGSSSGSGSGGLCVGASLVLVPEAADGSAAAVLCTVASEDPEGASIPQIDLRV